MIKVTIINKQTNLQTHGATFDSLAEANEWIADVSSRPSAPWGKNDRWERTTDGSHTIERTISVGGQDIIEYFFPQEYLVQIDDITEQFNKEKQAREQILKGKNARLCCEEILDFIAGYNINSEFTAEQITLMQSQFEIIYLYLKNSRPWSAKPLIQNISVSEIVSQDLKDGILDIFSKYSI